MKAACVCLIALFVSSCMISAQTVDTVERSFTVSGAPRIVVRGEDGRTEISSHGESRVEVRAVKEVVGASGPAEAERLARNVEVRVEQRGESIEVEARHPQASWIRGPQPRVLVHVEVRAPRRSDLDVTTEDGPVTIRGFEGTLRLSTEDGDVSVSDCSGSLHLSSEDGDVDLRGISGEVRARVEDGDLTIEGNPGLVVADASDGDVDVRLGSGAVMAGDWSIGTQDGSIRVAVPRNFSAEVDARVEDGSIRAEIPLNPGSTSEREIRSRLNEGGHRLTLRSQDGRIRLLTSS